MWRDGGGGTPGLEHVLRHPPLWRPADPAAGADRRRLARCCRRPGEPVADFLARAGRGWRDPYLRHALALAARADERRRASDLAPHYVRLSGEVADQAILDQLARGLPRRRASPTPSPPPRRASASRSRRPGRLSGALIGRPATAAELRVSRTARCASARRGRQSRYLGAPRRLLDEPRASSIPATWWSGAATGIYFAGRREGVINVGGQKVHPEEVEAVINRHPRCPDGPSPGAPEPDHRRARRGRHRPA